MTTPLPPTEVGDLVTADSLNAAYAVDVDAASVFNATVINSLVTATGTDGVVLTLSNFPFKAGYAYEIDYFFRCQASGGTAPYDIGSRLRRASVSGTIFHDNGNTAQGTGNFGSVLGRCVVKCTTADTTQTVVLVAQFVGTGGGGNRLDIENASSSRSRMYIRKIGLATDFTDALEMPTA
jgi:hypothetical protein